MSKNIMFKFLEKIGIIADMGIQIGPWDPLKLSFSIKNALMKKGALNVDEAKAIIREALPDNMPDDEKEKIVDSMIIANKNQN